MGGDESPLISVVIPCHHEPLVGEIARLLLDRAREDAVAVEVLIVGIGDFSALPAHPAVRVISVEHPRWPGPKRNRGLSMARAPYVLFLDGDCLPRPGFFTALLATQRDGPTIAGGAVDSPWGDFWPTAYNLICLREYLSGLPASPRRTLPSFCLFGPRDAFSTVDGFDESWTVGEDLDLTARLDARGWRLRFAPAVRVLHWPAGRSFARILRNGWAHGGTSMRARAQYPEAFGAPRISRNPLALALGAPLVAAYYAFRTWLQHPDYRRLYPAVLPAMFVFRAVWCYAAAWSRLRPAQVFLPVANRRAT